MKKIAFDTKTLCMIAVFASLNYIAGFIPLTPIIGMAGKFFKLSWILSSLSGIILGPIAGSLAVIIAKLIRGRFTFGLLSLIVAGLSAFQCGLLIKRKYALSFVLLASLILYWMLLLPEASIILIVHLVALALIIFIKYVGVGTSASSSLTYTSRRRLMLTIYAISYVGNTTRHILGTILSRIFYNLPAILYISILPLTIMEQILFALGTTIIAVPTILAIQHFLER